MESYKMLSQLEDIPKSESVISAGSNGELYTDIIKMKDDDIFVDASIYSTIIGYQVLETRNIPDELFEAYAESYTRMSENTSLYEKYKEVLENGEKSVIGLVNGVKGKFFEFHVEDNLSEEFPGFDFTIAPNPTQPVWDISGENTETGETMLVQVKMWKDTSASKLSSIMEDNPDVLYATSSEIREKILKINPELEGQFIPIDISNYEFTENVKDALETLKGNLGFDLPDEIFALAPYSTEIILGLKTISDIIKVNRDYKLLNKNKKSRMAAVKVLILFQRFGVNSVLAFGGGAAGTLVTPGLGTAVGSVGGLVLASQINKYIQPHSLNIANSLVGINQEDYFYFKNMEHVHSLAISFRERASYFKH
ncbi:DUF456 domain-containing protein [Alkalicoccus urumqiensis]|uniref:DUF456 domain-containing protein n=1 Tax=Alkalicoccus urumqiensis TaxID=1548213 RepID=A0A2P6MHU4_ALKUR|nr:DUF456 domain-containing protein [Alkalicoccus urumqiensis]PRO65862.1 DUF456 domain-containing protein [Alkalicoccus urumqiensis]